LIDNGAAVSTELNRNAVKGRQPGSLGVAALRGGDVAGEHTVMFLGASERLELTHRASSAEVFPRGALAAARWLCAQPPALYTMADFFAG
jgi:4-hydroxy-tetrahydrodipicolinate reductase